MIKRELLKSNVPYKAIEKGVEVSVFGRIIQVRESNASNPRMVSWNYKGYKSAGSMDIDELTDLIKQYNETKNVKARNVNTNQST